MARTITGPERTLLAGKFGVHTRVEVQNDDDTWIDLSNLDGQNFVVGASFGEEIDIPIAGASVQIRKQLGGVSLAPLVEGSPANVDDSDEYAPLLNGGRGIKIWTASVAPDTTPVSGDWKLMFWGKIDEVDFGPPVIALTCRDLGARIADTFIEDEVDVAEPAAPEDEGVLMETLMQDLLDANNVPGDPVIVVPATSAFVIRPYRQKQESVFDALRTLVLQRGWDFRYRFGSGNNYDPTLYDPARGNTTPVLTIPPSEYLDVSELRIGDADIRNKVRIRYLDRTTGEIEEHNVQDNDSLAVYGPRFMEIAEASTSQIDTDAEADTMALAILDDLSSPYATHQIELPYFWPVQLHDVIALPENFVHYDTPQIMAVVSISHTLSEGRGRTTIEGRGKPAGAFMEWLRRAGLGRRGEDLDSVMPVLLNFRIIEQTATTRTYAWTRGRLTRQVWVGQGVFSESDLAAFDAWSLVAQNAVNTPPLGDLENEITVLMPAEGETFLMQVEPRGVDLFAGEVRRVQITGTPAPFEYEAIATEHTDGTAKLEVTVDDPRGVVTNVRFWKTIKNIRTGPHAATSSANPVWAYSFTQQAKHATLLQIEFVRGDGEPNFWSDVFSFDRDNLPEIQSVNVSYALDEATVIVDGDTDTDTLWYDEDIGGVLQGEVELDYRGAGTDHRFGVFTTTASTEGKRLFRVYAKNADGDSGVYREVEINQHVIATRFVQVVAEMTAVTETTWEVTVDVLSPVAGGKTVELLSIEGDATIVSGPAIGVPSAAPQTWVFNRPTALGMPSWAKFEGAQSGLESDQDSIIIPEIGADTIALKLRVIPLISTDPTKQNVRVLLADPVPIGDGTDYASIGSEAEGVGTITHSDPTFGADFTSNPTLMPFTSEEIDPDAHPTSGFLNYLDFEIERPTHGSDPGRVSFFATAAGRAPDTDHVTILPVDRLQMQVDIEQISESPVDVEVTVTVTDPKPQAGDYITLTPTKTANIGTITPSSSGDLPNGGTRSFLIPLPEFRAGKGQVIFTATAAERVAGSNFIDVPEIAPDPAGNLTLTVDTDDGGLDAVVVGDSEIRSWKWLASDTAEPTDNDVETTGTLVNSRDFSVDDTVLLDPGQKGHFKAVPYYFTDAAGDPGVPLKGTAIRPVDTIAAPGLSLGDPDEGGDVPIAVSGDDNTESFMVRTRTDDYPTDADILNNGSLVNGQTYQAVIDANLDFGDPLFAGVIAFTGPNATGAQSPTARAKVTRQNKATSKILRIAASSFYPDPATPTRLGASGDFIEPNSTLGGFQIGVAWARFNLGPGAVVTGVEMLFAIANSTSSAQLVLTKLDGAGGHSTLAHLVVTGTTTGYEIEPDMTLDDEAGDFPYVLQAALDWETSGGGNRTRLAEVAIYYDVPTLENTV